MGSIFWSLINRTNYTTALRTVWSRTVQINKPIIVLFLTELCFFAVRLKVAYFRYENNALGILFLVRNQNIVTELKIKQLNCSYNTRLYVSPKLCDCRFYELGNFFIDIAKSAIYTNSE
jgi:hypothetical protein